MAKINISIPDRLLERVDEIASDLQSSRSGFIAEATAHYVTSIEEERAQAERRRKIDAALGEARRISQAVEPFDSTAAVRADRDRDAPSRGRR